MAGNDDLYNVPVGGKLTREQLFRAAGGNAQKSADQNTGASSENVKLASEKAKKPEDTSNEVPNKQNQEANRSFRYPLDMKDTFPAKVKFQVIKVDGVDIYEKASEVLGDLGQGFTNLAVSTTNFLAGTSNSNPPEEKRKNESVAESNVTAAESTEAKKSSGTQVEGTESFENKEEGIPYGDITLPLMQPLRYSDVADYNSNTSLGIIGGAIESGLKGGSPFDGITEADGRLKGAAAGVAAQAIVQNAALATGAVGLVGAPLAKALPIAGKIAKNSLFAGIGAQILGAGAFDKAAAGVAAATRVTGNPNLRTLFKGVQMRPFTFDFKMVAYSPEEAREIKNIVKMFRTELYPESIDFNNIPVAYKFPNMFEISVTNKRGEHPGFKFQRCYLQNVETTFNEQAQGMFSDGQFVEVAISLKFIEIVTLTRQKVRDEDL